MLCDNIEAMLKQCYVPTAMHWETCQIHWGRTESTYTEGVALPAADSILCECHLPQYILIKT